MHITENISFKIYTGGIFVNSNWRDIDDYLLEMFSGILDDYKYKSDDLIIELTSVEAELEVNKITIWLKISFEKEDNPSESEFYKKYKDQIEKAIKDLEFKMNDYLANDDLFGYIPDAYLIYKDDRLYVQLGYHQKSLDLEFKKAYVEIDDDYVDMIIDDMFVE